MANHSPFEVETVEPCSRPLSIENTWCVLFLEVAISSSIDMGCDWYSDRQTLNSGKDSVSWSIISSVSNLLLSHLKKHSLLNKESGRLTMTSTMKSHFGVDV